MATALGIKQVTIKATSEGVDPACRILRSESEDDEVAREILCDEMTRMFSTQRGSYVLDPLYGLPLEDLVGENADAEELQRLPLEMVSQARRDERVLEASAEILSSTPVGPAMTVRVRLRIVPRVGQPYKLTLDISQVSVAVLKREVE